MPCLYTQLFVVIPSFFRLLFLQLLVCWHVGALLFRLCPRGYGGRWWRLRLSDYILLLLLFSVRSRRLHTRHRINIREHKHTLLLMMLCACCLRGVCCATDVSAHTRVHPYPCAHTNQFVSRKRLTPETAAILAVGDFLPMRDTPTGMT